MDTGSNIRNEKKICYLISSIQGQRQYIAFKLYCLPCPLWVGSARLLLPVSPRLVHLGQQRRHI